MTTELPTLGATCRRVPRGGQGEQHPEACGADTTRYECDLLRGRAARRTLAGCRKGVVRAASTLIVVQFHRLSQTSFTLVCRVNRACVRAFACTILSPCPCGMTCEWRPGRYADLATAPPRPLPLDVDCQAVSVGKKTRNEKYTTTSLATRLLSAFRSTKATTSNTSALFSASSSPAPRGAQLCEWSRQTTSVI